MQREKKTDANVLDYNLFHSSAASFSTGHIKRVLSHFAHLLHLSNGLYYSLKN